MTSDFSFTHPRYRLLGRLGEGGMGIVYRVFDRLTREVVALKQLKVSADQVQHNSLDSDATVALAQEFRILAGLRHPHIVSVLDYGFDAERHPFYTMEFIEQGQTFNDVAARQTPEAQTRLVLEILQALVYLHRRGVVHRDLKPANVLVTAQGNARVVDFGLALLQSETQGESEIAGTMNYMAPELWMGEAPSAMSDLYAVGVMLYEMLTGANPFSESDGSFSLSKMLSQAPDLTRLPPHWAKVVERLLTKSAATRYPSAQATIQAIHEQMHLESPPESDALRESFLQAAAFVGREREMEMLEEALSQALAGRSQLLLLGGESGSGKSRLLDELRPHALTRGALVLRGQAVAEGGLFYQLWRDVVRPLVLRVPLNDLEASVLKSLVPDIAALLEREVADAPRLLGLAEQERLAFTVIEVIKRCELPLLLLLEDLQWAEESLFMLQKMATVLESLPRLLVLGTYRHDERPSLPDELPSARAIVLARLDEAAIRDLVHSMLGEAARNPNVLDLIYRETEGNAFFMVETVRALAEDAGTLDAIGNSTLPSAVFAGGVQRLVERRLSRLPDLYRPLLEHMAVAGRVIDEQVLRQLATPDEAAAFLQVGADAAVLEVADDRWRFAHDKLREGLLRTLPSETLASRHRAVAEAIEGCYPNTPAYDETLMEHWQAAADPQKELSYLLPIVKNLVEVRAEYARAEALIVHGLALLGESQDARMATLLNWRGVSLRRQGDYSGAQESAQAAYALAERLALSEERAHSLRLLGGIAFDRGEDVAAHDYLQQSLALCRALQDDQGLRSCLNELGNLAFFRSDFAAAADYYRQSEDLARQLNDSLGITRSLNNLGNVAVSKKDFGTATSFYEQSLAISHEIGDVRTRILILNNLGIVAYFQGDFVLSQDYYQRSGALARQLGDRPTTLLIINNLAELAFDRGSDDLLTLLAEALALNLVLGPTRNTIQSLLMVARWAAQQGQATEAARLAGLFEAHPATGSDARPLLAALTQELAALLPTETLATYMQEGAALDLVAAARDWQQRLAALLT